MTLSVPPLAHTHRYPAWGRAQRGCQLHSPSGTKNTFTNEDSSQPSFVRGWRGGVLREAETWEMGPGATSRSRQHRPIWVAPCPMSDLPWQLANPRCRQPTPPPPPTWREPRPLGVRDEEAAGHREEVLLGQHRGDDDALRQAAREVSAPRHRSLRVCAALTPLLG